MGLLDGRVAIVTGGGRGLGRSHALHLAAEGASVVVNDLGVDPTGAGRDAGPARAVVEEIEAAGGTAISDAEDIGSWDGSRRLIRRALEAFGDLHILVNNAGHVGGGTLVDHDEAVLDGLLRVHLKGTFATTRWATAYWKDRFDAGHDPQASIVNTSSASGLRGIVGQTAYGAAKAGVLTMSLVAAAELAPIGVRVNVICPAARTRLTLMADVTADAMSSPEEAERYDPANVSPVVVHLADASCSSTGLVLSVGGGRITAMAGWRAAARNRGDRWTPEAVANALSAVPPDLNPLLVDRELQRPVATGEDVR